MANPQIDQFMDALFFKAGAVIVLCSLIGMALNWLKRKANGAGRARRRKLDTTEEIRRSQTAATGPARPTQMQPPAPPPLALSLEDLNWENFELLAGEIFRRKGFEVEISSGLGADGGKDLTLRQGSEVRLVQCKRLAAGNKVSVMDMREFYGLIVAEKATCGIFMTTGLYSRDAREFADGKPIKLLGRVEIEQLMASVTRAGENLCNIRGWIKDFAAVSRVTDPDCPRCRKQMKLRRGTMGKAFWSCSSYAQTRCRGKRDARTELVRAFSYQRS